MSLATGETVLTRAWVVWWGFVLGLLVLSAVTVGVAGGGGVAGGVLFVLAVVWSILVVPAVLVMRGHVLRAMWESRPADPVSYYKGLVWIWGAAGVGAVLAMLGCWWSGAVLPGGVLAGALLMLIVAVRPSRSALGGGIEVYPVRLTHNGGGDAH